MKTYKVLKTIDELGISRGKFNYLRGEAVRLMYENSDIKHTLDSISMYSRLKFILVPIKVSKYSTVYEGVFKYNLLSTESAVVYPINQLDLVEASIAEIHELCESWIIKTMYYKLDTDKITVCVPNKYKDKYLSTSNQSSLTVKGVLKNLDLTKETCRISDDLLQLIIKIHDS